MFAFELDLDNIFLKIDDVVVIIVPIYIMKIFC